MVLTQYTCTGASLPTNLSKERQNHLRVLVDELIGEVLNYRRQQVKQHVLGLLEKKLPDGSGTIKERKTKFVDEVDQYLLSFKFNICLKKCALCDLKCIKSNRHTDETKELLGKKKEEVGKLKNSFETSVLDDINRRMDALNEQKIAAKTEENKFSRDMNSLLEELKYLTGRETIESEITELGSEIQIEEQKLQGCEQKITDVDRDLRSILPAEENLEKANRLLENFEDETASIMEPAQYNETQLNILMNTFYENQKEEESPERYSFSCFTTKCEDLNQLIFLMNKNIERLSKDSISVNGKLNDVQGKIKTTEDHVKATNQKIEELETERNTIQLQHEGTKASAERDSTELERIIKELEKIQAEKESVAKEIDEKNHPDEEKISTVTKAVQYYMEMLQEKRKIPENVQVYSPCENIEIIQQQEVTKLEYFTKARLEKESKAETLKTELESLEDTGEIERCKNDINKNEESLKIVIEKLEGIQTRINSIQEHGLMLKKIEQEFNELQSILAKLKSIDNDIQTKQERLQRLLRKIDGKKTEIVELEKDDPENEIDDEKQQLKKHENQYEKTTIEIEALNQQVSTLCNDDDLLSNVLKEWQSNLKQEKQTLEDRLRRLSDSVESCNQRKRILSNTVMSHKEKLVEQEKQLESLKQIIQEQKTKLEGYTQEIDTNKELKNAGVALLQSVESVKTLLENNRKKLSDMLQIKAFISERESSTRECGYINEQLSKLRPKKQELDRKLSELTSGGRSTKYQNSHECDVEYQKTIRDYQAARSNRENVEKQFKDLGDYARLAREIEELERKGKSECDCGTDHSCSGICQICTAENASNQNPCMFKAGHSSSEHKCNGGHICNEDCQICAIYGKPKSRCHFAYGHKEPTYHQCESIHQCPATCICSEPCSIPLSFNRHDTHECGKQVCWKPCVFSCGKPCATLSHNHDETAQLVDIADGHDIRQVKNHLCSDPHYCKGICDSMGICKQEYTTQRRKWTTESGMEFDYDHIEVKEIRAKCEIKIPGGKSSHTDSSKHQCSTKHTCPERCPDCGSFCKNSAGHSGVHSTLHRNKDQHIFTSTNPNDQIEIHSGETANSAARKYKVGESAKPETCSVSCKRRGRSHFHLIECPGGSNCFEKQLGGKAQHSNETFYFGPDQSNPHKYDKILCSSYWSHYNWLPPMSEDDKKTADICNTYCITHASQDENGNIKKDSIKGFCILDAWHQGYHSFECHKDHSTSDTYEGIDICFAIDTTGSMLKYFEKVKTVIGRIIDENQVLLSKINPKGDFKFAVVDYRDHPPEGDYAFQTCEFTTDINAKQYVSKLTADSGGDFPEAVLDGLDAACDLKWRNNSDHLLFHILDAPPHGRIYHSSSADSWPDGCPCGRTAEKVLQQMKNKNISYHVLHCTNKLNMMINEFKNYIDVKTLNMDEKISLEDTIVKQVYQQLIDTEITLRRS